MAELKEALTEYIRFYSQVYLYGGIKKQLKYLEFNRKWCIIKKLKSNTPFQVKILSKERVPQYIHQVNNFFKRINYEHIK